LSALQAVSALCIYFVLRGRCLRDKNCFGVHLSPAMPGEKEVKES
jgi:hypothetical protein